MRFCANAFFLLSQVEEIDTYVTFGVFTAYRIKLQMHAFFLIAVNLFVLWFCDTVLMSVLFLYLLCFISHTFIQKYVGKLIFNDFAEICREIRATKKTKLAGCALCYKNIVISSMRESALKSHATFSEDLRN